MCLCTLCQQHGLRWTHIDHDQIHTGVDWYIWCADLDLTLHQMVVLYCLVSHGLLEWPLSWGPFS